MSPGSKGTRNIQSSLVVEEKGEPGKEGALENLQVTCVFLVYCTYQSMSRHTNVSTWFARGRGTAAISTLGEGQEASVQEMSLWWICRSVRGHHCRSIRSEFMPMCVANDGSVLTIDSGGAVGHRRRYPNILALGILRTIFSTYRGLRSVSRRPNHLNHRNHYGVVQPVLD